jgi:hypothetical protein
MGIFFDILTIYQGYVNMTVRFSNTNIMHNKHSAELISPTPQHEQQRDNEVLHAVFCEHTVENIPLIVDALNNADIVALESVGNTKAERERFTQLANGVTHSVVGSRVYEKKSKALAEYIGSPESTFSAGLIHGLAGSNKSICLVDVGHDDPDYFYISVQDGADMAMAESLRGRNIELIKEKFEDKLFADARASGVREKKVVNQVEDLVTNNPAKVIVLVAGAVHTPISHALSRSHNVERTFIGINMARSHGFQFSTYESLLREKTINPDRAIDETKLKYGLLELIVAQYDLEKSEHIHENVEADQLDVAIELAINNLHRQRVKQRIARSRVGR